MIARMNTGRRRQPTMVRMAIGCALLMLCGSAAAHSGTGLAGGFGPGFAHPFTGIDHLLAMVSVGLWGAFLGPPLLQALPVVFPGMMVGGAVLAMLGVPLPPVEAGIAVSVLLLGTCIALRFEAPVWLATAIVACFGIFHGYAHGKELPSAADPVGYSAGFVLATGLLHVTGIGLGFASDRPGGGALIRGAGGLIAAMGVWFGFQVLRS
jgi:urease accessory protein